MNFWDYSLWNGLLQFAVLAMIIVGANLLRRNIKFLRNSLLPSAVIGGLIILMIKPFWDFEGFFSNDLLDAITYHALALGFIALSLKTAYNVKADEVASSSWKSGMLIVGGYLIQAVVGLGVTLILSTFTDTFAASGILLPLGFGQGPGQANNFGTQYEQLGFVGGKSFGLSIASIGFIVACIVGVIYINYLKRKGIVTVNTSIHTNEEKNTASDNEVPLTESVDKFTLQVSLVLLIFFFSFVVMKVMDLLLVETGILGNLGTGTVRPLIWGFNFIFGVLIALLFKRILKSLKKKNVVKREYCDNFLLNRIAGFTFDFMIVASIIRIDIAVLSSLIVPLLLVCAFGTVCTFVYLKFMCKRIYPTYTVPAFLAFFGMLTGTASTGIALLREVDPYFETPSADNLVTGSSTAIIFGFPLMLLVGLAPSQPLVTWIVVTAFFGVIAGVLMRITRKKKV